MKKQALSKESKSQKKATPQPVTALPAPKTPMGLLAHSFSLSILVVLMILSVSVPAQNVVQERTFEPFTILDISGVAKVELVQGSPQSVVVNATPEEQDLITVKSSGDALKIHSKGSLNGTVVITTPQLQSVKVTEAASLTGTGDFIQETLKIEGGGASSIKMNVELTSLETALSGAAVATLSGRSMQHTLKLSGASNGKCEGLSTLQTTVTATGASNAKIQATEKIDGNVTGASRVALVSEPLANELEVTSIAASAGQVPNDSASSWVDMISEMARKGEFGDVSKEAKTDRDKEKKSKKKDGFNGHFQGVELGINSYMNSNHEIKLPEGAGYLSLKMPNSLVVNLNLLEANLPLIKQNFGLLTGMGIEFNNYKFEEQYYIKKVNGKLAGVEPPAGRVFDKSKLSCSYLKVPFMMEYQTNSDSKKNSFHIAGGANLGLRLRSHTKYKYEEAGKTVKEKEWDRFYLNPFRVAGVVKVGWGPLNFFAEYNFLPMFESGKGPELYPVSVGIALANW